MPKTHQRASGGQGRVKDPGHDGRLKQNRARGISKADSRADREPGGQGRVKNPNMDRRLKANREREEHGNA